jgi:acetate kinase
LEVGKRRTLANDERLILALNCGSSSLKFGVYRASNEDDPELVCEGEAEEIGTPNGSFWFEHGETKKKIEAVAKNHAGALAKALEILSGQGLKAFWRAGHRVVHGGPEVHEHQAVTPAVLEKLKAAIPFAPLHLPVSLAVIDEVTRTMPHLDQLVCLDTAFHRTLADVARTLPLPVVVRAQGVKRYGFHGLSLESIMTQLEHVPEKLVVAHLGNGASVTAIRNGRSIDTSMGLTPTGGVMMGTRCGDLDPGVMVFLARHGFSADDDLEDLVNRKSGLLGVSGSSSDVRQLMGTRGATEADLALRMFCYQVRKTIGAMAAALGGIDLLVFTGGIGEHAEELRHEICEPIKWLGDFEVRVLPAQENLQIARIALSCPA